MLSDVLTYFGEVYTGAVAADVPAGYKLALNNSPNPFNPKTTINFVMPKTGQATLKIYNVRGACIRNLVDGIHQAGANSVDWDGTDDRGAAMSTGVYFAKINACGAVMTNKLALVR